VAVTVGPGLSMCLRVGVVAAQNLCALHNKVGLYKRVCGTTETFCYSAQNKLNTTYP
jgi:tRNA A37 threonylcarbamoyladenosine modification protein TsaB